MELRPMVQLALLLGARWAESDAKPLSNGEWHALAQDLDDEAANRMLMGEQPDDERVKALLGRGLGVFQRVDLWMQAGVWIATRGCEAYPKRLEPLGSRAPMLIFGYGDANLADSRLAVFGSRNALPERLVLAAEMGRRCAEVGIGLVSGAARGVDEVAMLGSLEAGGRALGVVADSLLKIAGQRRYREALMDDQLCLISEVHPEAGFEVGNAMSRNRLAYAMADAALVVEAEPDRGGTWAGAVAGIRDGVQVYVLDGAIAAEALAKKGAIIVDAAFSPEHMIAREVPADYVAPTTKLKKRQPESGTLF